MSVLEPIVAFTNVVFSYGRGEVLHSISFELNRGEVIGLLGPNGAVKTTTLKIIAGLLAPGGGAVSVAGLPLPERAICSPSPAKRGRGKGERVAASTHGCRRGPNYVARHGGLAYATNLDFRTGDVS